MSPNLFSRARKRRQTAFSSERKRLERDDSGGFAEGNFKASENVQPSKEEGNFFNQSPGNANGDAHPIHLNHDSADQIRNPASRYAPDLINGFSGSLMESEGQPRSHRQHGQIGARIDIHRGFQDVSTVQQNDIGHRPMDKTGFSALFLVSEGDQRETRTNAPRWGILATKGVWRGYRFRTRLIMEGKSRPLMTTRRLIRITYWLAYRPVSILRKASKFLVMAQKKYISKAFGAQYREIAAL